MPETNLLSCPKCNNQYAKDELQRDCSNCFACTGCEIYICPDCSNPIVVKPAKKIKPAEEDQDN